MSEINKDRLRNKIVKSKELTALEKRYLEELIKRDNERRAQHVDKTDTGNFICIFKILIQAEEPASVLLTSVINIHSR